MSGRGASADVLAEQAKDKTNVGHLFEAYFDDETVRACDFGHSVEWNGHTYAALGHFITYNSVRETAELLVSQAEVVLSNVDQTWIARVLTKAYLDRRIVIYEAYKHPTTGAILVDPVAEFDGLMGRPKVEEDPSSKKSELTIACTNHLVDFDRRTGRHTNDSEQQLWAPGDKGFDQVSEASQPVLWGRSS